MERKRLGRGLSSLISATAQGVDALAPGEVDPASGLRLRMVPVSALHPNPYQPREEIDPEELQSLADSIRHSGVLQPIVLRTADKGFEVIAGERRWRASVVAGLDEIPAIIREATEEECLELALIENLQRQDLDPVERARAYERYCREFALTAEEVGERLGEDRSTIANYLRLLDLPAKVLALVKSRQLSVGHARALLPMTSQSQREVLAKEIVAKGLSVRSVEGRVRLSQRGSTTKAARSTPTKRELHVRDLEAQLEAALQTRVRIRLGKKGTRGKFIIHFHDTDEFDAIARMLGWSAT